MANKKIWELPSWVPSGNTSNNTIPIDNNFFTQKISLSAITEYVQNNITTTVFTTNYDELRSMVTGSSLNAGSYYLITDFQTCYDQPNFNNVGDPIINGNYKTGSTEPLLVFATSENTLSPQAYSPQYPLDKITYDITWNVTEVTSSPAKGRIIERIDDKNNRADYDFREIQFIRYEGFFSEQLLNGKINIDPTGLVTGFTTFFNSNFVVGDILGVYSNFGQAPIGSFWYFEITSITGDTEMYVTGTTIPTISDTYYSRGVSLPQHMSPFQCNVTSSNYTGFSEYYTFNNNNNLNTYLGNFSNYNTFLLPNNVFLSGTYRDNYFNGGVEGNTFNDDMDSNTCGSNFKYNIITNDFDDNTVGTDFQRNIIDCDMDGNIIGERFRDNMIGDYDGWDFDYNTIGANFSSNFLTMAQDNFINNNIGYDFYNNIIDTWFENNKIVGTFYNNLLNCNSFTNNTIGTNFINNDITGSITNNVIGNSFESNTIYGDFYDNQIFNEFKGNITYGDFNTNKVDWGFSANEVSGSCGGNSFGPFTVSNDFLGDVYGNAIKSDFIGNTIGDGFGTNNIGSNFVSNTIAQNFANNEIGNFFTDNTIGEGFGFGGSSTQKNYIGDEFYNNTVGEYFYNNRVSNYFQNNTLGDYFQWNVIDTDINLVDFTPNYGNITAFTYTTLGTGTTDGIYTNLSGTTNGHGVNASFNIEVSGNTVIGVSGNTSGKLYKTGDTITIPGSQIGGVTGLISGFTTNKLSVKIYKPADSTYEFPNNETEMDYLIDNSPLFDTYYSPNTQGVSYTTKTGVDQNQYGMVIDGYIKIPSGNTYYFGLSSDDGSDAFINGVKVADWYGAHGDNGNIPDGNQYPITLTAGTYSVKVRLQERNGQDIVSLLYSSNSGSTWNIIPDNWFPLNITGTTGSYPNIFATGTGGENATFDVTVIDGVVDSVVLSNGGGSYLVGEILTIPGSAFGSTEDITITVDSVYSDDVIVTVTGIGVNPSVYEHYTCQIFERQGGDKRLSYYDSSNILTIKNINE